MVLAFLSIPVNPARIPIPNFFLNFEKFCSERKKACFDLIISELLNFGIQIEFRKKNIPIYIFIPENYEFRNIIIILEFQNSGTL